VNLPSSKKEAERIGAKRFFTGKPCANGHIAPQYTLSWACCECRRIDKNKYKSRNIERLREQDREYARRNANKRKENSRRWRELNPQKRSAMSALQRAARRQAVPSWLTKEDRSEIGRIYALSQWMASVTGEIFHVDHIYPLISDFMCGLHLPSNLVVLSASDNLKKSNTWWPSQLDCQKGKGISHDWWTDLQQPQ
jgi:hypothetical protein